MENINSIPYAHHYRCFPQMIGSAVNQSVFMYLMDEYSHRLKDGRPLSFNVSINEIKKDRNLSWKSVANSLQSFQKMKLITFDGSLCTLDGDRFVSLIKGFNKTGGEDKRKEFSEFLEKGDYDSLKKFGFQLEHNSKKELLSLKGGGGLSQILEGSKKSEKVITNFISDFSQMLEPSKKSEKSIPINATHSSKKSENLLTFLRSNSLEIVQIISESCDKAQLLGYFQMNYNHFLSDDDIEQMVEVIFDKNQLENVDFGIEWFSLFLELLLTFLRRGFSLFLEEVLTNVRTVNKGININKINNGEVLFEKNQNTSSNSSSTHQNFEGNISQDEKEEFIDFNFLNEVSGSYKRSTLSYQDLKNKSRLPYFPVEEIEKIISDPSNCLDRPDKIFINQVWECLLPFFVSEEEGENEEIVESQLDPEGMSFYADRIIQDIITPAFQETQDIISSGKMNVRGIELPVTASELDPDDVQRILDFQLTVKGEDRVYIISKKSFRNIFADLIPVTPKRATKEGREEDKAYMQEIILLGDDDERYKDLTPIELVIYNFLSDYFKINEDGSVEAPTQKFVNRVSLSRFYLSVAEKGLTEKDFLSVLFSNTPDKQTGCLTLKPRMFSSAKIKEWNAIKGHESKIEIKDNKTLKQK
ncbi:hypothetical protein [Bacteroides sp. 224]|uniref:hypothetical protein n=1 Tax=Bacteroides sp. 224 TaxID=2302936 RepID=UPI0013D7848B|nr:hypothetical protein [Bacteroides sp. 224]NDV63978.1 hypothetical protein [Bacteroides sp. 224]